MAFYNRHYSYPDMFLWQDETYEGCMNTAGPLFLKLAELIEIEKKTSGEKDFFPGRSEMDLWQDEVNRVPYFQDYLEAWKKAGMHFSCSGMMGELMAPTAVKEHQVYEADVLYIPYVADREDPKQGMNLLEANRDVLEYAAENNILVQFAECRESVHGAMIEKLIESQGTFRLAYKPIWLDISLLKKHGLTISDIPGLDASKWPEPREFAGRWVIDISDQLEMTQAHQHNISVIYRMQEARWHWDFERHIHTLAAKRQAESMHLEFDCRDHKDPKMAAFWKERGIRYEDHLLGHELYITLAPEGIFEQKAEKLPVLVVMKEARTSCPASTQTAFQFYYDFIELCAQGQFIMLFFALETPEDNDEVLPDIINEVLAQYPADPRRVYLTGQSHNGYYALEYYRRHPKQIAALAQLCDQAGLQSGAVIDYYKSRAEELIASFRAYDMPMIDINGSLENNYAKTNRTPQELDDDIFYFQNRMRALKMKVWSREQILAAKASSDYATRRNGLPADRTDTRFMMGDEVYISDYRDENGRWLYRFASIENTPHMIMPQMAELSWEFMRRFARDPETGESIELY